MTWVALGLLVGVTAGCGGVVEDTLNARTRALIHALELRIPAEPGAAPDAIVPS